ncbi:hypothetical protein GCM10019016_031300 [Streptomyces prasinosporus]|uniref:Serine/threonine protein kinase n=1 Tax=Streptomyces prasinosporus TaxID=68256 RepID=A0ABP6TMK8_9ACTN
MTGEGAPRGRRARFAAWYRDQDSGVKAAVIGFAGAVVAALIGAAAALAVTLIGSGDGGDAAVPPTGASTPADAVAPGPVPEPPATGPGTAGTTDAPSSPVSAPSSPASAPSSPASVPSSPAPAPEPTPVPPAPQARERWSGTLVLDGSAGVRGWFLDPVPPGRAPVGDLAVREPGQVYGNALAAWGGSAPPSREQCAELLHTRPGQRQLDVRVGDRGCLRTEAGRIGVFEVTAVPDPDHLTVAVTVWQLPS